MNQSNKSIYLFIFSLSKSNTYTRSNGQGKAPFLGFLNRFKPNRTKKPYSVHNFVLHTIVLPRCIILLLFFSLVVFHTRKTNQNEITSYKRTHKHTEPILSGSFASVLYILYIILLLLVRYNPILLLLSYWYVHRRKQQQKTCIPL